MADAKISALPASTTPLAGTETLPIVQSGTTKKVSVANLTAGRAVSVGSLTSAGSVQVGSGGPYATGTIYADGNWGMLFTSATSGPGNSDFGWLDYAGNTLAKIAGNNFKVVLGNVVFDTAAKGVNFTANTPAAGMTSQLLNWYEEGTWTPTSFDITYAAATGSYTRIGRQVFAHFSITLPTTSDANNITIVGLPFTVANTDQMRTGAIGYTDYGTACTLAPVKNTTRGNIFKFDGVPVTNANASGKVFAGVFIYNV